MRPDYVEAPFNTSADAADDFRCRKFTAGEASAANAIPKQWHDKYVILQTPGDVQVHFGFSTSGSAAIDPGESATAAGAVAGVGGIVPAAGIECHRHIPKGPTNGEDLYFVRATAPGDGSTTVIVSLADRPGA